MHLGYHETLVIPEEDHKAGVMRVSYHDGLVTPLMNHMPLVTHLAY